MKKEIELADFKNCPFFSLCIPVYNNEKFLTECIDSIINQTETDYEIILIDDGSTDNSGHLCDEYSQKYKFVKVIHQVNSGPFLARYKAIVNSTGKYLLFVDSDDKINCETLRKLKKVIGDTNADIVLFELKMFGSNGIEYTSVEPFDNYEVFERKKKIKLYEKLVTGTSLNSMCKKCVKRNIATFDYEKKIFKNLSQCEDKLMSAFFMDKAKKIVYFKEQLYEYRINPDSTTNNSSLKHYKDIQVVYSFLDIYMDKWNLDAAVVDKQKIYRLRFAVACIRATVSRIKQRKSSTQELRDMIDYISNDEKFIDIYSRKRKLIPFYKRLICRLIVEKKTNQIIKYVSFLEFVGQIKTNFSLNCKSMKY